MAWALQNYIWSPVRCNAPSHHTLARRMAALRVAPRKRALLLVLLATTVATSLTPVPARGKRASSVPSGGKRASQVAAQHPHVPRKPNRLQRWWSMLRDQTPMPAPLGRILYAVTAINPALFVITNRYQGWLQPPAESGPQAKKARRRKELSPKPTTRLRPKPTPLEGFTAVYLPQIFYFARLKPRLLFVIGGVLRGLQLTTPIQYAFDPPAGCGAGLNLLCLLAGSRWPAAGVLGFALCKPFWRILGAETPHLQVPISVFGRGSKK